MGAALAGSVLAGCTAVIPDGFAEGLVGTTPDGLTEAKIAMAINAARAANGKPAWTYNAKLKDAARAQAELMAVRDTLSHNVGASLRERVDAVHYDGIVGENLAGGYPTLEEAVAGWLTSPGHRETLLSTRYIEFGLAVARGGKHNEGYGIYWAMLAGGGDRSESLAL